MHGETAGVKELDEFVDDARDPGGVPALNNDDGRDFMVTQRALEDAKLLLERPDGFFKGFIVDFFGKVVLFKHRAAPDRRMKET